MAIFDEQVLEPFVAKGLGNSGIASRQIRASNLPDLSAAVRQSIATQENLADQQKMLAKSKSLVNLSNAMEVKGGGGGGSGAFVVGQVGGDSNGTGLKGYTVAIPKQGGGYSVKTVYTDYAGNKAGWNPNTSFGSGSGKDVLKSLGIDISSIKQYPSLAVGGTGLSGDYSGEDLMSNVFKYGKSFGGVDISSVLKRIKLGGTSSKATVNSKLAFNPSVEDQEWSKERKAEILQDATLDAELTARNALWKSKNISSMGGSYMGS